MGIYTTPTQLRLAQRRRFDRMIGDMGAVHREFVRQAHRDFIEATGGRITSKQLAEMGHPFGRLGGAGTDTGGRGVQGGGKRYQGVGKKGQVTRKGVVRPLPINKQTGALRRGITVSGPVGVQKTYRLFSNAPHAKYVLAVDGTRRMVARGLLGQTGLLRKRHRARKAALIDVARRRQRLP